MQLWASLIHRPIYCWWIWGDMVPLAFSLEFAISIGIYLWICVWQEGFFPVCRADAPSQCNVLQSLLRGLGLP